STACPKRTEMHCVHVTLISLKRLGCYLVDSHKILDEYDLEEISSQSRRSDRNAAFLDILPRRGNVLDFVLKVMQGKREYQDAAALILQRRQIISLAHT
ncbi:hypothetical protein P5673_025349, partial [Acropora cervicornis]